MVKIHEEEETNRPPSYRPLRQEHQSSYETRVPHRRFAYQDRVGACVT